MSFFNNLLGLAKKSKGNKLEDNDLDAEFETLLTCSSYEYDITFTEKSLGLKVGKGSDGLTYVVSTEPGSLDSLKDISKSDRIVAVDKNPITSYQHFVEEFSTVGRPTTITFYRNEIDNMKMIKSIDSVSEKKLKTNSNPYNGSSYETEKQRRRELMAKAAIDREKGWDRRVAVAGKRGVGGEKSTDAQGRPIQKHAEAASLGDSIPETQRIVEAIKQAEQRQTQAMGYNPFQPHMSFATNTNRAAAADGTVPANVEIVSNGTAVSSEPLTNEEFAEITDGVDEAFALLMSGVAFVDPGDSEAIKTIELQVNTAVLTMMKMLANLQKCKDEQKFRSIRLMNDNFQSKVASVAGAVELMMAAGFELVTQDDDTHDVFLRHDMSPINEHRLDYTLQRLTELQQENTSS